MTNKTASPLQSPSERSWPDRIGIAAAVEGVLEVSLYCTSDLSFWQTELAKEGLRPTQNDGRAEVLVSAASARFKGVAFRELSFSVFTTDSPEGTTRDGAFLLHAFNSVRFFAWVERTFFATPYYPAQVTIEPSPAIAAAYHGTTVFNARRLPRDISAEERDWSAGESSWSGPIYLPARNSAHPGTKLFYASLQGEALISTFAAGRDDLHFDPPRKFAALQQLKHAGLAPDHWLVRRNARHVKSKTVSRHR